LRADWATGEEADPFDFEAFLIASELVGQAMRSGIRSDSQLIVRRIEQRGARKPDLGACAPLRAPETLWLIQMNRQSFGSLNVFRKELLRGETR